MTTPDAGVQLPEADAAAAALLLAVDPHGLGGIMGAGTGVCGVSAIIATAPVVGAKPRDMAYAIGTIDFTGDMPVILGPDGPSLGGFVCPATVIRAERWKLGQLRPGDTIRFRVIDQAAADKLWKARQQAIDTLATAEPIITATTRRTPVLECVDAGEARGPVATARLCHHACACCCGDLGRAVRRAVVGDDHAVDDRAIHGGDDVAEVISQLNSLRQRGVLTDEEFAAEKAKILNS